MTSNQQIILCTAYVEKQVSDSRLQPLLETHSIDVAKDLNYLVDNGFLVRNNNGRWTTYEICESYVKRTSQGVSWDQVKRVLSYCLTERSLKEIMSMMNLTSRNKFRANIIVPLSTKEYLSLTIPGKPNSPKQKYVTTSKGKELLNQQ